MEFSKRLPSCSHNNGKSSSDECVKAAANASFQLFMSQSLIIVAQSSDIKADINVDILVFDCSKYLCCVRANKSGPPFNNNLHYHTPKILQSVGNKLILPVVAIINASANRFALKHKSTAASILFNNIACVIKPSISKKYNGN